MSSRPDVGTSDTLPLDDARTPVLTASAAASPGDRYELLELLGKGGMGSVYKARDRRLGRTIALKFLHSADPRLTMRFLREARAQARIDHPNICRVYEVGEVEGRAFLALQLVGGEPLHRAAARMSLDEKVAVMRDIAAAIQEAHRLGIVHRDLKPANVMVDRSEDGRWVPVVMDFGLARETTLESGLTESGALLGTPAYMSPEQARGDVHAVDRRSDVYSLGATLYELLTGQPPFPDTALAQALAQVIHDDPPAPRSLVSSLPVDLETIAQKCLAKDPAQRYPSARALADDLARYLAGEPILGRRLSVWQRLRLRARRHRAVVILGAWSLAIIVGVASFGVHAWLGSRAERARAAERARLAQQLGQDAKEIELALRVAYLLPLHDIRPDREAVRARMRSIAATRHDLGDLGDAVIHDALGRGHLALHEWREAAEELGHVTAPALQTPELHAARGRALGELYHRALEEARRSGDAAWLAGRQQELARQYLTPALAELEQSRASGEDAGLLEARMALDRRDFAAAERRAREVAARTPGSFEAHKLAADAAYGAAMQTFDRGDYDAACPGLANAASAYAEASEIARSDPSVYEAAAQAWLAHAEADYRRGRSAQARAPLERALDVIARALDADPDNAPAYTTRAYVLLRWYRTPALADAGDQRPLLERIAQAAARATEIDPRDASAWDALGNTHIYRGIYEDAHQGHGEPWWNRAIDEIHHALRIRPDDPWANNDVGVAHRWLGFALDRTGRDPISEYRAALRGYERATLVDPHYLFAWCNQADLHKSIAEHDLARGGDPRPAIDRARRAGERGLAVDPNYYSLLDTLAEMELVLARYLVETGGDPTAALASARGYLERAAAKQSDNWVTWYYRLSAASTEAKLRLREGTDPSSSIAIGRAALAAALRLRSDSVVHVCYVEAARLDLVEAAWAARAGGAMAAALAGARADAEKAVLLNEQSADAQLTAAEVYLQIAAVDRSRVIADRGVAHAERALALNPRLARATTVRAALSQRPAP